MEKLWELTSAIIFLYVPIPDHMRYKISWRRRRSKNCLHTSTRLRSKLRRVGAHSFIYSKGVAIQVHLSQFLAPRDFDYHVVIFLTISPEQGKRPLIAQKGIGTIFPPNVLVVWMTEVALGCRLRHQHRPYHLCPAWLRAGCY